LNGSKYEKRTAARESTLLKGMEIGWGIGGRCIYLCAEFGHPLFNIIRDLSSSRFPHIKTVEIPLLIFR
jgi:hypothetical protein